jgi:hypothetical protein
MTDLIIPLILTLIGLAVALNAYSGVRRGGARFYTLEREAMLRRATLTLLASVFFFLAAVGYLIYTNQQLRLELAVESGETVETIPTPTVTLAIFPPTPEATATIDLSAPTPTNPPILRRGVVDGTGGSGLYLRSEPGGEELEILPDGDIVTLVEEPSQEFNGFTWVKVRLLTGVEGWVVEEFLIIRDR